MNRVDKDKLGELFSKIQQESPSMSFENKLMIQIKAEQHSLERKRKRNAILGITGGIAAIFCIPAIVFYFLGYSFFEININFRFLNIWQSFKQTNIDPLYIFTAISSLLLLIADDLIRKKIKEKEKKGN